MRFNISVVTAIIISLFAAVQVNAQAAESIWITSNTLEFKTGETVVLGVNAISATPIQGFNFQIRYDANCLSPVNAASPIAGMNGLLLPQNTGLTDATFASTTPQIVNGLIAEVRFTTLGGCQTELSLENATLAIRNESGFAAQLPGVTLGNTKLPLNIDSAKGADQNIQVIPGTPISLAPNTLSPSTSPALPAGTIAVIAVLGVIFVAGIFIIIRILRNSTN